MSFSRKWTISLLVAAHLMVNFWHSGAHDTLAIALPAWKLGFIAVAALIAPVVAGVLVWTRFATLGLWVLLASMLAALLFGVYHHYVLVSPDNVAHLPDGPAAAHAQFIDSAVALWVLELAAVVYAAIGLFGRRHTRQV